jgi:uncharacterized low-complexity protein
MMRHSRFLAISATLLCLALPARADVTISSAQTANMNCSAGVCATAKETRPASPA